MVLFVLSGCNVTIGDRERPLVSHGPIKGDLELVAEKHIDKQGTGVNRIKNETTELQEKLRLETEGDIYHQNLLTYAAAIAFGLRQSRFDFDGDADKGSGTIDAYSLSGQLLPTKPYPMRFHLDKSEQYIPRLFSSTLKSETERAGGALSLRLEDWPMQFQYSEGKTKQKGLSARDLDLYTREDENFRYSLEHDFSELSNLSFEYESDDLRQERFNTLFNRKEDRYNLRHDYIFGNNEQHRFDSYLNLLEQSGDYELERIQWQERLILRHSDTFDTNYNFTFNESKRPTLKNDEIRVGAGFTHRLYESLVTTGNFYTSEEDLGDGVDISRDSGTLVFDYKKKNPWGTLFGNYIVGILNLEQTGGSTLVNVVDERHPFTVAGSMRIELDRTNIDTLSIVVMDSGRSKIYSDYTVSQIKGITEILIIPGGDITTDGDQTLSIDYDFFTEPQRDEEAFTERVRIGERFRNGLSLYYEFQSRDQQISSTDTDIIPDEFEINTFGADYVNKGLRLLAEYSREKSTRSPSRSKRLHASYLLGKYRDTKVSLYATNSWIDYTGTSPADITLLTLGADASSKLSDKYSIVSNIDYRDEDDSRQGITKGLQWAVELQYVFRQLRFSTGVEFNHLDRLRHETENTFLYFRLKRTF
jgi:hypothetical protein